MSLPSKVVEAINKAVGEVVVAAEVALMPVHKELFLKKNLAR
jgi:hypothetical protein